MALDVGTNNGVTVYTDTKVDATTEQKIVVTYDADFEIIGSQTNYRKAISMGVAI